MKRLIAGNQVLIWMLLFLSVCAVMVSVILTAVNAPESDFFHVPFASWFVLGQSGLIAILVALVLFSQRRLSKTRQDLSDLQKQTLAGQIAVVEGHELLAQPEFPVIVQSLFRQSPNVKYVHVLPLRGGYGGSTTIWARLRYEAGGEFRPGSFVIKLGDQREMANEHARFDKYVRFDLTRRPDFFAHAEMGRFAGIAYEFAKIELKSEIQNLHEYYQRHTPAELSKLIDEIYSHLGEAWYQKGKTEYANLSTEYGLLIKKKELIVGQAAKLVDKNDPYRDNFSVAVDELRPDLKPGFCPVGEISWHDPVAFLRAWAQREDVVPIYRSVIHGDLNARNILVEIGRANQERIWFIDFSHTGNGLSTERTGEALEEKMPIDPNRGHTLRDFCRLEADIKFILTRLENEVDLKQAIDFEKTLMREGLALADLGTSPMPIEVLRDARFFKAWQIIREIRARAVAYLGDKHDSRPYYFSLLNATLPIVYYQPSQFGGDIFERWQKRYALISAGMLCGQLRRHSFSR